MAVPASFMSMAPKIIRDLAHFSFRSGQHHAIVSSLLYLVRRPRLSEAFLQIFERVGAHRPALPTQDDESHWPIETWDFLFGQGPRDFLRQTKPRHTNALAVPFFHVIIDVHLAIPDRHLTRQLRKLRPNLAGDERVAIYSETRGSELVERVHILKLRFVKGGELRETEARCLSAGTLVRLAHLLDDVSILTHRKMTRLSTGECFRQEMA